MFWHKFTECIKYSAMHVFSLCAGWAVTSTRDVEHKSEEDSMSSYIILLFSRLKLRCFIYLLISLNIASFNYQTTMYWHSNLNGEISTFDSWLSRWLFPYLLLKSPLVTVQPNFLPLEMTVVTATDLLANTIDASVES